MLIIKNPYLIEKNETLLKMIKISKKFAMYFMDNSFSSTSILIKKNPIIIANQRIGNNLYNKYLKEK
jgi:hypothetical protein